MYMDSQVFLGMVAHAQSGWYQAVFFSPPTWPGNEASACSAHIALVGWGRGWSPSIDNVFALIACHSAWVSINISHYWYYCTTLGRGETPPTPTLVPAMWPVGPTNPPSRKSLLSDLKVTWYKTRPIKEMVEQKCIVTRQPLFSYMQSFIPQGVSVNVLVHITQYSEVCTMLCTRYCYSHILLYTLSTATL